jgi:uncharacterized caspase-like protein
MFQRNGFDIVNANYDVGNLDFKRAIRQFEDSAAESEIAVIYYAGHGIEIHGINYLVPVDAKLASDRDSDDEAITLERLVASVDGAKLLRIIILDACRDNPFVRTMKQQRTAAVRGVSPGLGTAEPNATNTLIAYAARAGSAALDGEGDHSPFATALLNNLFVPGLDIRLAFGRVRDEVLKGTADRQEPYVYGSLGGENIALVPAPNQPIAAAADLDGEKRDYNLVQQIGTNGAWQVFLKQHPTGYYADLARQQIAKLTSAETTSAPANSTSPILAALEPTKPPKPPEPSSEEQRAWNKIKDSSDAAQFRAFIKKFPTSVLASVAQSHAETLEQAAREKAEREAAQRAEAERQAQLIEAKRLADEAARKKAEQEAALARAQQEAQAAEQARQSAEREAALKREEEEHQKQLAEAARAKQQADADAAKKKAEQDSALALARQEAAAAEQARQQAEREAALKRDEEVRQAALAEAARVQQEVACKTEQDRLNSLEAAGGSAKYDLQKLEQGLTCERLRPLVATALDRASAVTDINTPTQIRSLQQELTRLGCYLGSVDGSLNAATKAALQLYEIQHGTQSTNGIDITDEVISELKKQSGRVCPLICPAGQIAQANKCVVAAKPQPIARQNDEQKSAPRQKAKVEERKSIHPASHEQASPVAEPRIRQEATSSSGHASTIGVGF